jgi:hypothetical protein
VAAVEQFEGDIVDSDNACEPRPWLIDMFRRTLQGPQILKNLLIVQCVCDDFFVEAWQVVWAGGGADDESRYGLSSLKFSVLRNVWIRILHEA